MARAAVEGLAFPEAKKEYIINVLDPVLEEMVQELLTEMPDDPMNYMISWLNRKSGGVHQSKHISEAEKNKTLKKELQSMQGFVAEVGQMVSSKHKDDTADAESEEDEDDDVIDDPPPPPPPSSMKARASVSAEAYGKWNQKKEFTPPVHPKTPEQTEKLRSILSSSFLFKALEAKDMDIILAAMKEMRFEPGARVITEGDDGDCLFVIEEGSPECKKLINGEQKVVKKCSPGDVVGELALLYNCPRAATVEAVDRCLFWQLDRETFNHIVKEAASKRVNLYDDFLKKVSLFFTLGQYERSQISDALKAEKVVKDQLIVKQGDQGDKFYIVEEGSLVALKSSAEGQEPVEVMRYSSGDYFGELALLRDQPRAASIKVTSDTAKVLSLDRRSFKKMLGPLQDLLAKQSASYA